MQKTTFFLWIALVSLVPALFLSSCTKDECESELVYEEFVPVFMTLEEANAPIEVQAARDLQQPGKIYFYNDYILVNELREGIHIINNQDPRNPVNVGFLQIPGNVDMAVKDNLLYADNLLDLVTIDISNIQQPKLLDRQEGIFENDHLYPFVEGEGYIVEYLPTERRESIPCDDTRAQQPTWWRGGNIFMLENSFNTLAGDQSGGGATGMGGSMARFTITSGYLYTVGEADLNVFSLQPAGLPQQVNEVSIGWGIETIYPYEDKLFIGSRTGMFIFDNSIPETPQQLSSYSHWTACDPVVVEGDVAYVTLRGGTQCESFNNQLDVIDISDILNPVLIRTYPMDNPHGLAVRNQVLHLCDGASGLKVYNVEQPEDIQLTDHVRMLNTYDAIAVSGELLLVIGADGLYQYDTSTKGEVREISRISVNP